jgi:hypothetical protein
MRGGRLMMVPTAGRPGMGSGAGAGAATSAGGAYRRGALGPAHASALELGLEA